MTDRLQDIAVIFGLLLLIGALWFQTQSAGPETCPVTINPEGTWTEDGWSIARDGLDWCDLNPAGGRDGINIQLRADRTWHIPN
ncbi:MAG: hypothetical protein EBU59_13100 [Planctomycetia bacterium]|nr:hypothetical protein [Planctomycetia bacterium]